MNRNTQIVINDDLLRKIVYCIEKAIGDDLQQYLRENHRETNNAIILLRGDNINTNLRTHVVKDDIDLVPFQRYGWSGRMVIDRIIFFKKKANRGKTNDIRRFWNHDF